jgi:hypothetical protein
MRPHPIVVSALKMISTVAPSWRVIPATDMIDKVCKDPQFKKEVMKKDAEPTQKINFVALFLVAADVFSALPCLNSCPDPFQPVHVQGKPRPADGP